MQRPTIVIISILSTLIVNSFLYTEGYRSDHSSIGEAFLKLEQGMRLSVVSFASFIGEKMNDKSGFSLSGAGDVNGDGFDDILIGAMENDQGGGAAGKTYLILGKPSGWMKDSSLSNADVSFIGEDSDDWSGSSVAIVGDVNGDSFDDIVIGANRNDDRGSNTGKTYLILGKACGWTENMSLSKADASFIGENPDDLSGSSIAGAGDVNGDGYDDILIGALYNDNGGPSAGKTYLIFGKESGWRKDASLSNADASFIGENAGDWSGSSVAGAGDVNGDGFDDFLIGAHANGDGGEYAGKTYLILGRASGWERNKDLSTVDGSFIGLGAGYGLGWSIAGAGNINGDFYDDFLIGAPGGGSIAGEVYLILGRASGWERNMKISNTDASFVGENVDDGAGYSLAGAGDVNDDGLDDILIGAYWNDDGGSHAGKTYLVYGKTTSWEKGIDLSTVSASFIGVEDDWSGSTVSYAGDTNCDGFDDILIGAYWNGEGGPNAGKTYLISGPFYPEPDLIIDIIVKNSVGDRLRTADIGEYISVEMTGKDNNSTHMDHARVVITYSKCIPMQVTIVLTETGVNTGMYKGVYIIPNRAEYFERLSFSALIDNSRSYNITLDSPFRPISVSSVTIHDSIGSSTSIDKTDLGSTVFIKEVGIDSNPTRMDRAFVNLSSDKNSSFGKMVILTETGQNTGIYIGSFVVPSWMVYFENITVTSVETESKKTTFMVHTPVQLRVNKPFIEAIEDQEYRVGFYNFGYNEVEWTVSTNAYWLHWDSSRSEYYGVASNKEVGEGIWQVIVIISDEYGNTDDIDYDLGVKNSPPKILTEPVMVWVENKQYYVDFNSDDDGQGELRWYLTTDSPFLKIDQVTGVVKGTPVEGDAGSYSLNVEVRDGNGGSDNVSFNLTVHKKNDRPQITTTDVTKVEQDTPYRRDYDVTDLDVDDTHHWTLRTDADWLSMENVTGVLSGTPDGYDVGDWVVNITVTDSGGSSDTREFVLTVLNVNDRPHFDNVPGDTTIPHGSRFYYDVNASDPDYGSVLTYSLVTDPTSDMRIDPMTGAIGWTASYRSMPLNGDGIKVTLKVSDGILSSEHEFHITVLPTESPIVTLISPSNGTRTPSIQTDLVWIGSDPDDDILTYTLYLSDRESDAKALNLNNIERSGIRDDHYSLTGLSEGKTYFWTVVADDGCTYGRSINGVFSLRVNHRPILRPIENHGAMVGSEFRLKLEGSDGDEEDVMTYQVTLGPSGMTVGAETGSITWTPGSDQRGTHTVTVQVSDGYETAVRTFDIKVSTGSPSKAPMVVGAVFGVLAIVILFLLIYLFVIRKGKKEAEEESKKVREDIEKHQKEKEWDESHTRPSEQQVVIDVSDKITAPPLTGQENPPTYEDLGSQTPPEEIVEQEGLGNDGTQRLVSTETETNETEHR